MSNITPYISICICTYKRPDLLKRLLIALTKQDKNNFSYSVIVVDNDSQRSAYNSVLEIKDQLNYQIHYTVEQRKNIALARNKAISCATGDFLAFIDDDEIPSENWLNFLYNTCIKYDVSGVLGPVEPYFDQDPPKWLIKSGLCYRPSCPTGTILKWQQTRTGNVLLKREILGSDYEVFNSHFDVQGEDHDFFKRMIKKGHKFIWCNEAPVYELVPQERLKKSYYIKRALFQGYVSGKHLKDESLSYVAKNFLKSALAISIYTPLVCPLFFINTAYFMKILIKDLHHISRILGYFNIEIINKFNFR